MKDVELLISREKKHAKYSYAVFGKRVGNVFVSYNDKIFSISIVIQEHIKRTTINGLR